MEIISATALISINETFFVQLISFLVFLFILNRVMIRPLINTMEQRKGYLTDVTTDIDNAKSDLDRMNRELDKQRSLVLKEADSVVKKLDIEADHRANELLDESRKQILQLRHETERRIDKQITEARQQLAAEVDTLTEAIMEKVLHRRLQA
jgi:F-type H+-transporting ATPase subunit b